MPAYFSFSMTARSPATSRAALLDPINPSRITSNMMMPETADPVFMFSCWASISFWTVWTSCVAESPTICPEPLSVNMATSTGNSSTMTN